MKPIDGEKLIEKLRRYKHEVISVDGLEGLISLMPSTQPDWDEMVVICDNCGHAIHVKREDKERKKGKWIKHSEWQADGECGYECDQCGMGSDVDYDFCMRCGADMRQGEKDE